MQAISEKRIGQDAPLSKNYQFSFNTSRLDQRATTNESISFDELVLKIKTGANPYAFEQYQTIHKAAYLYYEKGDHRSENDLKLLKKALAWIQPAGYNSFGHGASGLKANGLIQLDIDFHYSQGHVRAEKLKYRIAELNFVALCAISPTKYGLKVFVKSNIAPDAMTDERYQYAQKQLIKYFSLLFDIEEKHFDKFSIAQVCYMPFDPSVYHNKDCTSYNVELAGLSVKQAQNERKTSVLISDDKVSQAAKFLIDNQICVASCYSEYLSFTAACKHSFGESGQNIAFDILCGSGSFNSSNFKKNFDQHFNSIKPRSGTKADKGTILHHAIKNGFLYIDPLSNTAIIDLESYKPQSLDLLIISRENALKHIKSDLNAKTIVCERSYIDTVKIALKGQKFNVVSYSDISNITDKQVYVLGSYNLMRRQYLNTLNTLQRCAASCNIVFFSETHTRLPLAKRCFAIDSPILKSKLIISEKPQSTFVEMVKADKEAVYLDTSESVKAQLLDSTMIKRSELYAVDKSKILYVLFDSHCGLMPERFAGFKEVVFIVYSEVKDCIPMEKFCYANEKAVYNFLQAVDNDLFVSDIEKGYEEIIKGKKLAVRKNGDVWERCNNTACMLEYEHELKLLVSDSDNLSKHLESYSYHIDTENAILSDESVTIESNIKESKKDLKEQKKIEFFEFIEVVEAAIDNGMSLFNSTDYHSLSRGAKEAYNRIKALLKVNDSFSMCVEAVKGSYTIWSRTKGQFYTSKVIQGKSQKAKQLLVFKDTTEGQKFTKTDLIEIASGLDLVTGDDKTQWKQLRRICTLVSKPVRNGHRIERRYEPQFL